MAPTRPVVHPPPLAVFNTIGRWGHRGGRAATVALSGVELLRVTTIGGETKGDQVDVKRVQRRRGCKTWEQRHAEQGKGARERERERESREQN
jgi:hypothetical protein